jgi:hypothetical protein
MIMKYGTGSITVRDDSDPDAPLTKAAAITEDERNELLAEGTPDED